MNFFQNDIFSNKIANNDIYYWKRWQEYGETVNIQNKKKIILDNGIIVYEINNLGKKNGQIKNGVFLPIKYGMHYGHLIIDFIGGYFQLKKIFPDLKIIFIDYGDTPEKSFKVCDDLIKIFNAELIQCEDSIILEKVLIPNLDVPPIPKNLFFELEDYFIESSEQVKQWYLDSAKEILNNLINIVDYDNKYSYNLYLSRSQANKRYINSCEEWDIKYRVHDECYDYPLDEIMHNNGYKVVNAGFKTHLLDKYLKK